MTKGSQIFDMPTGGRAIANFTGGFVPMVISDIPSDPINNRSRIATSLGAGSLRIDGFVQTSIIAAYTTRDIPIMAGNVWLASAQKVKLAAAAPGSVTVERSISGSRSQIVRATASCDALALQGGTPTAVEVPPFGRGYLTKESNIAIYDQPNGNAIFALQMLEGSQLLFWSSEQRGGFVHGKSRFDLAVDGWLRASDLEALKQGENYDTYIPPQQSTNGVQLAFETPPRIATATKEILIRLRRDEKERPIGVIEPGTELYILETIAGWTNILPKNLHVMPPDDAGFWIVSSETPR